MKEYTLLLLSLLVVAVPAQKVTTPTIEKPQVAETHYFTRDKEVTLECRANGEPSYKWYKDGKVVVEDDTGTYKISFDSRTGDLTIPKYDAYFNGDYHCVASIGDASSMSQIQTLLETRIPPFKEADVVVNTITEYAYTVLECANQGELVVKPSELSYNWYISVDTKQVKMDNGRLFIDKHGDLHFTYVKLDDRTQSADLNYLCGYSSLNALSILMGSKNSLSVTKADPQGVPPVLRYSTKDVVGIVGSDATLECFISGYDTSTVNHLPVTKWYDSQNNEIIPLKDPKYLLSDDRRVLTVTNLREEDDKNFYCEGTTKSGNTGKKSLYLNVTSKPVWEENGPQTQTKTVKSDAVFECKARSFSGEDDPEEPIWYINGKEFSSTLSHHKFIRSLDRKTLTIKNLRKPDDIMCVQCIVKNSVGNLMGDACLNVVTPIKVTVFPPAEQKIKKGDLIDLTFEATSDEDTSSKLDYEWHINNKTYTKSFPTFVTHNVKTNKVYINTSEVTDKVYDTLGGQYKMVVSNPYDTKIHISVVTLLDIKPLITEATTTEGAAVAVTASAGIDMWIIGLIIGIIFLIIVIAIIIFVICRKQQEGDYNVDKKETGAGLDPEKELRDKGFNDLSRPDYDDYDYPEKKPRGDLEYDDVPIGGDDESLGEYGDEEDTHFNEDGSFIGIYQKKENERQSHKTESTI